MKLILSRKGFDSSNGRCASPIFEDGTLCPIPIPQPNATTSYARISFNGEPIAPIVDGLTRGRIGARDAAHLDPDLRADAIARRPRWRPIFGQAGAAQSHLARQRVGAGDLFLFFGWFRRVERRAGSIRYVGGAPDLHLIFGWMQVSRVCAVTAGLRRQIPWAREHPHLVAHGHYSNNAVYIARERIELYDLDLPGAGTFTRIAPELILTQLEPYVGRSTWALPRWVHRRGRPALSHHHDPTRWTLRGDSVQLRSAPIGQEFVLDLDEHPEARGWLTGIFRAAAPRS